MRWSLTSLRNGIAAAMCGMLLTSSLVAGQDASQNNPQPPAAGADPDDRPADQPPAPGERRGRGDRAGERPRGPGGPGGPGGGPGMFMARLPIMMALDADRDGEISTAEIDAAATALKKLDKNSDGKLSVDELMPEGMPGGFGGPGPGLGGPGNVDPTEMVTRIMSADKNQDGYLDKEETPERMQPVLARADTDGDGKLSKEEVTKFFSQMSGRRGGEGGSGPRGGEGPRGGAPRGEPERPRRPTSE